MVNGCSDFKKKFTFLRFLTNGMVFLDHLEHFELRAKFFFKNSENF